MTFTPPTPPTPPAPAVRPTPPKPPRIDKTSFANDSGDDVANEQPVDETEETSDETPEEPAQIEPQPIETPQVEIPHVNRKVEDPESMARDAVANGSGPLTKRTVDRGDEKPANQTVTVIPPDAPLISDEQSDYDRGKDILRQFREEDARATQEQSTENFQPRQTVTEQPRTFKPSINYHEGHGGAFWIGTIIFVAVASFVVVKKFLFTDKPALTKSELFADETDRLKAAADKVKQPAAPPPKSVTKLVAKPVTKPVTKPINKPVTKPARPSKDDDDKGKHFEIRI
ncbi:MAG: hypothetical protein IKP64_10780 [Selenomonadaceae bacterium]|nr:hypothetical protein [Selenomonadaceae bacterium]